MLSYKNRSPPKLYTKDIRKVYYGRSEIALYFDYVTKR